MRNERFPIVRLALNILHRIPCTLHPLSLDPYRGAGTIYLHGKNGEHSNVPEAGNPTGAVVFPISLATTFQQSSPGLPTAPEDPNSFGLGYEYSRTGTVT